MSEEAEEKHRYTTRFSDGEMIAAEGPGKGFASHPWALDRYERALGLSPSEAWLLHRMLKHSWESGGEVFISMRKVCREATISRGALDKLVKSLLQKGYIDELDRGHEMRDHRVRYDVSGVFVALVQAIRSDPGSEWAKGNEPLPFARCFTNPPREWFSLHSPADLNQWHNERGQRFNWCDGRAEEWNCTRGRRKYQATCEDCGEEFTAGAANAIHCPACRDAIRARRWENFQAAYDEFAEAMEDES